MSVAEGKLERRERTLETDGEDNIAKLSGQEFSKTILVFSVEGIKKE